MKRTSLVIAVAILLITVVAATFLYHPQRRNAPKHRRPADRSAERLPVQSADRLPAAVEPAPPVDSGRNTGIDSPIHFDVADAGIDFRYFNSADPATPGAQMYEFTGGGVGAVDFDLDGRPDLYFTQGCAWPPEGSQTQHLDRLYRNVGDRFVDVTGPAGVFEPSFSQGVACGDYDSDGFPDVYVGNIGENRLFRNNGDGTFSVTGLTNAPLSDAPQERVWTTSVAIADLNGDALPDLFDVNYVAGADVFERICDHDGTPRVCSPTVFDAASDRMMLNRGDGAFSDVTNLVGLVAPAGTGLGVIAADFDGTGQLGLFVANDARPNHFFRNVTESAGALPRFEEAAVPLGLATDASGASQACMGVAAGDANGDGRLDLFVTNYVDEANALYVQQPEGNFIEASRDAGLVESSRDLLGFGTQFVDADGDGWQDLVVANGHVDDFRFKNYAFDMPAQVFRNDRGRFVELSAKSLGSYFETKHWGRGLARIDWNGDGRVDFAVSHLEETAALLTNATPSRGHSMTFRLKGTASARDAIGARVEIGAGDLTLSRQLTAGDGYQASNERILTAGLGDHSQADVVTVHWPSGRTDRFEDLATGATWLMIEGRSRPLPLTGAVVSTVLSRSE